jgi:hypothetical protein
MRRVLLAGANPFLTLYDESGAPTAYASVWRVDWSIHGPGGAIVLWHGGQVRVLTDAPALGGWLAQRFVRHFDEATALPSWPAPQVEAGAVSVTVDPAGGTVAAAAGVEIRLGEPLDARPVGIADFPLAGLSHGLSMTVVPCGSAALAVDGQPVAGSPRVWTADGRTYSSAVTAVHETWCG